MRTIAVAIAAALPTQAAPDTLMPVRSLLPKVCLLLAGLFAAPRPAAARPLSAGQAQTLVNTALANELRAAEDASHPMRYLLRKQTPRLSSTRAICETRDGAVARLLAINGSRLSPPAEQKEIARLEELLRDPVRQRHRKLAEAADTARALTVLRLLPRAFLYEDIGPGQGDSGPIERFRFRPNPQFTPPNLEAEVLTAMAGEIWIDPAQQRVTRLEGRLQHNVSFAWGILGRLYKGGWIRIDQAEIAPGQWRTVRLELQMNGRVLFRARDFDLLEEESRFSALPAGIGYPDAIHLLLEEEPRLVSK